MAGDIGLEWSILDCEEDEWAQAIGATGAPVAEGQPQAAVVSGVEEPMQAGKQRRRIYQCLTCTLLLLCLGGLLGLRLWLDAERGVALIKQDIANVVTLETVKAGTTGPLSHEDAEVRSVDFRSDRAMVQVVVTRTAQCGTVIVQSQTRFYVHDGHGWRRGSPAVTFWGEQEALDLPHLHFIYYELDRDAVKAIAAEADALQASLDNIFSIEPITPSLKLTIEILPSVSVLTLGSDPAHLEVPSPVLLYGSPDDNEAQLLARLLRIQLVRRMLARLTPKPQWTPMLEGMNAWLLYSDELPLPQGQIRQGLEAFRMAVRLDRLALPLCLSCATNQGDPWGQYNGANLDAHGNLLVEFVADRYGLGKVAELWRAFDVYEDWDALAPAVFGLSAEQLLAEWQTWWQDPGG